MWVITLTSQNSDWNTKILRKKKHLKEFLHDEIGIELWLVQWDYLKRRLLKGVYRSVLLQKVEASELLRSYE